MKKKLLSLLVACACISSTLLVQQLSTKQVKAETLDTSQNQIYSETTQIDLSDYDVQLVNETPTLKEKNLSLKNTLTHQIKKFDDKNAEKFNEITKDKGIKDFIIKLVNDGKKPGKISTKTVYDEKIYDKDGNQLNDRLLTQKEVSDLNLDDDSGSKVGNEPVNGHSERGKCVIALSASNPADTEHWLQAAVSWSLKGVADDSNFPANGDDFMAINWPSKYYGKANASAVANYSFRGLSDTPSLSTADGSKGYIWSVRDLYKDTSSSDRATAYLKSAYFGVGVTDIGTPGYTGFTATYTHTWKSFQYSASFSASGTPEKWAPSFGLSVTPLDGKWDLAVPIAGDFN